MAERQCIFCEGPSGGEDRHACGPRLAEAMDALVVAKPSARCEVEPRCPESHDGRHTCGWLGLCTQCGGPPWGLWWASGDALPVGWTGLALPAVRP